jgi:hypothetical protein
LHEVAAGQNTSVESMTVGKLHVTYQGEMPFIIPFLK